MLVTPYTGVWIETHHLKCQSLLLMSHPTRVCGLKPEKTRKKNIVHQSHPTRVCGLKPLCDPSDLIIQHVTPYTGVWIETA